MVRRGRLVPQEPGQASRVTRQNPMTLRCDNVNDQHTQFTLIDWKRANCGVITILTDDVRRFMREVWRGNIDWQGLWPHFANRTE